MSTRGLDELLDALEKLTSCKHPPEVLRRIWSPALQASNVPAIELRRCAVCGTIGDFLRPVLIRPTAVDDVAAVLARYMPAEAERESESALHRELQRLERTRR